MRQTNENYFWFKVFVIINNPTGEFRAIITKWNRKFLQLDGMLCGVIGKMDFNQNYNFRTTKNVVFGASAYTEYRFQPSQVSFK